MKNLWDIFIHVFLPQACQALIYLIQNLLYMF